MGPTDTICQDVLANAVCSVEVVGSVDPNREPLSERERQIVRLGARGLTDKEIAERLSVSITTVRTYWIRLRRKLNATNRAQAIAQALHSLDRGRLREAAARLLDQPWMGVAIIDESNQVVEANAAFRDLLGAAPYPPALRDTGRIREPEVIEVRDAEGASTRMLCSILPLSRDGRLRAAYLLPLHFQLL